jgi:hypothetical protein
MCSACQEVVHAVHELQCLSSSGHEMEAATCQILQHSRPWLESHASVAFTKCALALNDVTHWQPCMGSTLVFDWSCEPNKEATTQGTDDMPTAAHDHEDTLARLQAVLQEMSALQSQQQHAQLLDLQATTTATALSLFLQLVRIAAAHIHEAKPECLVVH